jgi:hypothetical protein
LIPQLHFLALAYGKLMIFDDMKKGDVLIDVETICAGHYGEGLRRNLGS